MESRPFFRKTSLAGLELFPFVVLFSRGGEESLTIQANAVVIRTKRWRAKLLASGGR
jgi:hypothetical protein